ncbi:MAG: sodium/sugar symporter [Bacteroidota bacterium]
MDFSLIDKIIFAAYGVLIIGVGLWVSRTKKGEEKTSEDYFLASKSLPWWAIGASLIAANISAEQFIGMSGSGFAIGLAIASYEWMAAITLIIVGKYFLPIFIEKKLYTIPEFLEVRYNENVKTILAIFWIGLYIFVNLTSVLYLGALALETIMGIPMWYGVIGLAVFAAAYSLYGGLSAVAWTDVIQVIFLVLGGLFTTYIALNLVTDGGVFEGLKYIFEKVPGHFEMILDESHPEYSNLPGIGVLIGGLWVANLYYWGFNQYIIQRTLAAKSLKESQKGIVFAAFLKLLIPLIVVIPGIAAYVIANDPEILARLGEEALVNIPSLEQADKAYPWLLKFLPNGVKGIAFAALAAAIVSSLASMLNSTSTIFTMDIYKPYINKNASEHRLVNVGRISAAIALIIAVLIAPMLGGIPQAFQYIQEYTGLVSPGILAIFILGLFWKKTSTNAAIWGAILALPVALVLKLTTTLPWMDQMGYTFLIITAIMLIISHFDNKGKDDKKGIDLSSDLFKTSPKFNISAIVISIILVVLYALFW